MVLAAVIQLSARGRIQEYCNTIDVDNNQDGRADDMRSERPSRLAGPPEICKESRAYQYY